MVCLLHNALTDEPSLGNVAPKTNFFSHYSIIPYFRRFSLGIKVAYMRFLLMWIGLHLLPNLTTTILGQQLPQLTQYTFQQLSFNPAYAGSKPDVNIEAGVRAQWVGVTSLVGIPLTQNIGVHLPIPLFKGGVGLSIQNDMLGAERNSSLYLSYAYRQKLGAIAHLAIGVRAGAIWKSLDGGELITPSGDYVDGINHEDPLLPAVLKSGFVPDFGAGLYFTYKTWSLGIASQHLLAPSTQFTTPISDVRIQFNRHLTLNSSYNWEINRTISLQPAILFKTDFNRFQGDVSVMGTFSNIIGGIGYRGFDPKSIDALYVIGGIHISNKIMLSYSYDFSLSGLNNFTSGSHELVLHYTLNKLLPKPKGKTLYSPRFL